MNRTLKYPTFGAIMIICQILLDEYINKYPQNVFFKEKVSAATALLDSIDKSGKEVIIAIAGKDATAEDLQAVHEYASKNYPLMEFFEVDGGQDIYSFIFAVE